MELGAAEPEAPCRCRRTDEERAHGPGAGAAAARCGRGHHGVVAGRMALRRVGARWQDGEAGDGALSLIEDHEVGGGGGGGLGARELPRHAERHERVGGHGF